MSFTEFRMFFDPSAHTHSPLHRFIFRRGYCESDKAGDHSLECGFWTMDLQVNGDDYLRGGEETRIYSPFTVPKGTSYACGENRLNTFRPSNTSNSQGASEFAYSFLGLQVCRLAVLTSPLCLIFVCILLVQPFTSYLLN